METCFVITLLLCLALLLKALFHFLSIKPRFHSKTQAQLPPGVTISSFTWLLKYSSAHGPLPLVQRLRSKLGPILTIYVGSRPTIWISDASLAHQALVKNGSMSADRFKAPPTNTIFTSNHHTVPSAAYGPTWQALRRNLASDFLSPAHLRSFSVARKWALDILVDRLETQSKSGGPIQVREHFLHSIFRLQCAMCFGLLLDEAQVTKVQSINRRILLGLPRFSILNAWPKLTKLVFAAKWAEIQSLRDELDHVYHQLIKARKEVTDDKVLFQSKTAGVQYCYVDSLQELRVPNEEGGLRQLTNGEMVSLCNSFINASTDLPCTELEWAMANLVKHPNIQAKLMNEIKQTNPGEIRDKELAEMSYLKAVISEVLRLHPPTHLLIPHRVEQDMTLGEYMVPKNASINVLVAEIGRDPSVWEEPMEFRPERFLVGQDGKAATDSDITGRKVIKMMPFGVGRRMCPGNGLARLNLEYLVANLVRRFEWKAVASEEVDLSEKEVFTIMMKSPLKVQIRPRIT